VFRGTVEPTARIAVGFLFTYSAPQSIVSTTARFDKTRKKAGHTFIPLCLWGASANPVFLEMPRSSDCCHTG
jgi:hypothetical protein